MTNDVDFFSIAIRKRPWWFWALAELWLLVEVLLVQTALASVKEEEYRAAAISWVLAAALAAAGVLAWLRRGRSRKPDESTGNNKDTSIPVQHRSQPES
ncbi:MAG: hypothetical protein ABSE99_16805 [Terracidiphilus sp.]